MGGRRGFLGFLGGLPFAATLPENKPEERKEAPVEFALSVPEHVCRCRPYAFYMEHSTGEEAERFLLNAGETKRWRGGHPLPEGGLVRMRRMGYLPFEMVCPGPTPALTPIFMKDNVLGEDYVGCECGVFE